MKKNSDIRFLLESKDLEQKDIAIVMKLTPVTVCRRLNRDLTAHQRQEFIDAIHEAEYRRNRGLLRGA